ncbi:MAG: family 43 glycosylhydrolase [Phycisphaerales bacterium]|nr:MAG: family 43 glycosylhydrolase [Phycisphaerales bacterium]
MEAPFIARHKDHWCLFVSFDFCCRGAKSRYNIRVGRSRAVTGPYVDRAGKPMAEGGGTLVIEVATPNWRGPGHNAMLQEPGGDCLVSHACDGTNGRSHVTISTMVWEDGWPRVAVLP